MTGLIAWLRAQIEADKAAAEACAGAPWSAPVPGMIHVDAKAIRENKLAWGHLGYVASVEREEYREHIARHGPRDVIADCDAKLAILDDYALTVRLRDEAAERIRMAGDHPDAKDLKTWDRAEREAAIMGGWVRLLAHGYRHRDGFKEAWRP